MRAPRTGQPPLVEEVVPSPDPWDVFTRLVSLPSVLFLDSAARGGERGRYSYITASPFEVIEAREGLVSVSRPESPDIFERRRIEELACRADPFSLVARRLEPWEEMEVEGIPPFQGGAAGLLGYGLSRWIEEIPPPRRDEFRAPDLVIGLHDWVVAFDHEEKRCFVISQGFPGQSGREREGRARQRLEEVLALLSGPRLVEPSPSPPSPSRPPPNLSIEEVGPSWPVPAAKGLRSNFSREDYIVAVERVIEYIRGGDAFQVNLSQRLLFPLRSRPLDVYQRLRSRNPAPFGGYFDMGEGILASSSPEQFLSLVGREVVTRPIKGTRPRGYTPEADAWSPAALKESEKDRAENVMIVDLLRNDLSRVSKPHSVQVPRLFEVERHPTVHHLVSEVRSELKDELGALDLLRVAFPGGSVTGAPKVRAMEIIAELEPTARGAYCGSLAWIAFHGGMSSSILIRTMTISRGWIQLPVGGGIVEPSNPEVEYQETLDKAQGMLRALSE